MPASELSNKNNSNESASIGKEKYKDEKVFEENRLKREARNRALRTQGAILVASSGMSFLGTFVVLFGILVVGENAYVRILVYSGMGLVLLGAFSGFFFYLRGVPSSPAPERRSTSPYDPSLFSIQKQLSELGNKIEDMYTPIVEGEDGRERRSAVEFDDEKKEKLFQYASAHIKEKFGEILAKAILDRHAAHRSDGSEFRSLLQQFSLSKTRLSNEIDSLGRRANVNLLFGSFFSLIGIGILGYVVSEVEVSIEDWQQAAVEFLPRLSLVILIEIFSYFFLRIYKDSLMEIKYFQNEITNMDSKAAALQSALTVGDAKATTTILEQLGQTERNFVLGKDQDTVFLRQNRIEDEQILGIIKSIKDIFKNRGE